ncbi:hypothetical protein WDZ92_48890, partial [Nostoc sp. NIES-2111]
MAAFDPAIMSRLGTRLDIPCTLMRCGYFGWRVPRIIGKPWRPKARRKEALSGLRLLQRYARPMHRRLAPLLAELDRRRLQAVGGWGSGAGLHEPPLPAAARAFGMPATSNAPPPAIPSPSCIPDPSTLAAMTGGSRGRRRFPRPAGSRRRRAAAPRRRSLPSHSPETTALLADILGEIETLFASKRSQAPAASAPPGPGGAAMPGGADRETTPLGATGTIQAQASSGPLGRPRPPPGDDDGRIYIMPGHG